MFIPLFVFIYFERFLASVRPLLTAEEYKNTEEVKTVYGGDTGESV